MRSLKVFLKWLKELNIETSRRPWNCDREGPGTGKNKDAAGIWKCEDDLKSWASFFLPRSNTGTDFQKLRLYKPPLFDIQEGPVRNAKHLGCNSHQDIEERNLYHISQTKKKRSLELTHIHQLQASSAPLIWNVHPGGMWEISGCSTLQAVKIHTLSPPNLLWRVPSFPEKKTCLFQSHPSDFGQDPSRICSL